MAPINLQKVIAHIFYNEQSIFIMLLLLIHNYFSLVSKVIQYILTVFLVLIVRSPSLVIADFGCGDCKIAQSVKNKVHCFDLVPICDLVTACDMANVSLFFCLFCFVFKSDIILLHIRLADAEFSSVFPQEKCHFVVSGSICHHISMSTVYKIYLYLFMI